MVFFDVWLLGRFEYRGRKSMAIFWTVWAHKIWHLSLKKNLKYWLFVSLIIKLSTMLILKLLNIQAS